MSSSDFNSLLSLPAKAGKHMTKSHLSTRVVGLGKLPSLITTTNTVASLDAPRVAEITVGAHKVSLSTAPVSKGPEEPGTGVYQTLESTTRFAIIVPPSVSQMHALPFQPLNKQDPIPGVFTSTRPKLSITVQRLGMQTPSPPWAVRHMLARGGDRFNLMSLPDFYRPASKRLAVQYVEGKSDVVVGGPKSARKQACTSTVLDIDLAPEQLKTFKHLVAKRTHLHRLGSTDPLRLAIHNNLARVIATSSRPEPQVGNSLVIKTPKSKGSQRMRRTRPVLPPLDTEAARAYMSTNPTSDSSPESPGPATPADEAASNVQASKELRISKDKVAVSAGSSRKSVIHRVHSKGSKARLSGRF